MEHAVELQRLRRLPFLCNRYCAGHYQDRPRLLFRLLQPLRRVRTARENAGRSVDRVEERGQVMNELKEFLDKVLPGDSGDDEEDEEE